MATFSTKQNRQFYVLDEKHKAELKATGEGYDKHLYFTYQGADTPLRSDMIPVRNIEYVKAVKAEDLARPLKSKVVTLSSDVNGGKVIVGQDYILRIVLRQFYGMSDNDIYIKEGAVHATADMVDAPEKFYQKMVDSLNYSFAREIGATVSKTKNTDGTYKVEGSNPYLKFDTQKDSDGKANGIIITEKEQTWARGTEAQEPVYFEVQPTTVYVPTSAYYGGDDLIWGKVDDDPKMPKKVKGVWKPTLATSGDGQNAVGNGKTIADLEWFCMGERGDQYREIGYPNYIPTQYLVDPAKEYNTLEIHYSYTGTGINSYKSEKDITLVAENASTFDTIIDAINTATGLSVKKIGA